MPTLTLHRKQRTKVALPYWVFINEQPVGLMRSREASLTLPAGTFNLSVRIVLALFKWRFYIGGSRVVSLTEGEHLHLRITDKERIWNQLFDVDLVIWIAKFFFHLPHPWNIVYEVLSNGFFIIWIARIWIIRKRYFKLVTY